MSARPRFSPCKELSNILLPAFNPCPQFQAACNGAARCLPKQGHLPRGFIGGFGELADIELVLIVVEPANPRSGTNYRLFRRRTDTLEQVCRDAFGHFNPPYISYHRNLRYILDICWPRLPLYEQLKRVWITESYLCSAPTVAGSVPRMSERACYADYLAPQLELLKDRVIVALGSKARRRIGNIQNVDYADAVATRNPRAAQATWKKIPKLLNGRRRRRPARGLPSGEGEESQ